MSVSVGEQGTIETVTTPRDRDRYRRLYASSVDDIVRFVSRRVAPSQVEDVVADAFLTVWRRVRDLPSEHSEARAWVFGIARHCAANATRGSGLPEAHAVRIAHQPHLRGGSPAEAPFDSVETRLDLAAAWRRLDATDQETLALTVFDELTSAEAGRVLGITAAAYRVRLMRARRALRRHLEPTPDQETTP